MFSAKKYKANISTTIIIFTLALIFFCICAIDTGYIILTRYKTQKITETTALYMVSYIKSKIPEERTTASLENIKDRIENLYSNKNITGYDGFKITDIELKNTNSNPKIKITTETYTPALFLRFFSLGMIKTLQTSYAIAEENTMPLEEQDTDSYTFKNTDIITDKTGDDIKISYNNDFLIFAGLEDFEGKIRWADVGSKTESPKSKTQITNGTTSYQVYCINKGDINFNLSKDTEKTIGLIKYIKIYKTSCSDVAEENKTDSSTEEPDTSAKAEETEEKSPAEDDADKTGKTEDTEDTPHEANEPAVTVLNSVRLIKKSEF